MRNGSSRSLRQSIPVAGDGYIARIAQPEDDLREPIGVAVAQIERAVAIDPDRILPIVVPIPRHRLIARQAIIQSNVGKAGVVRVLQEDHPAARAEDTRGVQPIPIPIAGDPYIARIAQVEAHLFCSR